MRKANRKRRFRPVRLAAIAALSVLFVAILLLVLVRFGVFDRPLVAEASRRLEAVSGLVLEAEEIDIDPFRLSLSLRKPVLRAGEGRGPVLRRLTADSIVLDVPLSVVFGGGLRFEKVRIVRPEAVLAPATPATRPPAAPPQVPSTTNNPAASVKPAAFALRIDDLELENGRTSWQGSPGSFSVSLDGIEIRIKYDPVEQSHLVSLAAAGGHLRLMDKDLALERLEVKARAGPGEIRIETFEAATRESEVRLAGTVRDYAASPEFDGRAKLALSVRELPVPVPLAEGAEGIVAVDLKVSGKGGGLAYEAGISASGLRSRDL